MTIVATRTAKPKKVLKELGFQGCSSTQALAGHTILDRPDQHQAIWKVPKPSLARGTRQYGWQGLDYYFGLLPSVAQPPFPLQ